MDWLNCSLLPLLLLSLLGFTSCEDDEPRPIGPTNPAAGITILPLGDSRVEGGRPEYESYRYSLWKKLVENNWEFDFIGSREDEASYPTFMDSTFDIDHEGTGGATTSDILTTVNRIINANNAPDVVLLGIGGNDILDGGITPAEAIENINQIIDFLQGQNQNVTIFLEQIAPGDTGIMTAAATNDFNTFNSLILTVAATQTDSSSQVVVVNMATGWTDNFLADPVHYNEAGAEVVGGRYYDAIESTLER